MGFPDFDFSDDCYTTHRDLAYQQGVWCVYKNATPVFVRAKGKPHFVVYDGGHLSLAKAGSGDVLAGIVGAHLATNLDMEKVLVSSLDLFGAMAARALGTIHPDALLPTDLIEALKTRP